jgi:opacity protein-like surface antigen
MRFFSLLALLVVFGITTRATAQTQVTVGPRVGFDVANVEELLVGVDARLAYRDLAVEVQPALDVYLPANGSFVTLSVNALYRVPVNNARVQPYAGGGLGFSFFDDATGRDQSDVGLNLVGGLRLPAATAFTPFAQAQITLGSVDLIAFSGGVLFDL